MPVDTYWNDDTKTVMIFRFKGDWTYQEAALNDDCMRALIESVDHQIVLLVDMLEMSGFPPMIAENTAIIIEEPYKIIDLCIMVGAQKYFDEILGIIAAIGGFEFDVDHAETIEEALAMIQRRYVP